MDLKQFNGMTVQNMKIEDMKLIISFEETEKEITIGSEDAHCGIELYVTPEEKKAIDIKAKDVFNCRNVFPKPFHECQAIAKSVGYSYMSFNGMVVNVNANSTSDYICLEDDLKI